MCSHSIISTNINTSFSWGPFWIFSLLWKRSKGSQLVKWSCSMFAFWSFLPPIPLERPSQEDSASNSIYYNIDNNFTILIIIHFWENGLTAVFVLACYSNFGPPVLVPWLSRNRHCQGFNRRFQSLPLLSPKFNPLLNRQCHEMVDQFLG